MEQISRNAPPSIQTVFLCILVVKKLHAMLYSSTRLFLHLSNSCGVISCGDLSLKQVEHFLRVNKVEPVSLDVPTASTSRLVSDDDESHTLGDTLVAADIKVRATPNGRCSIVNYGIS